MDTYVQHIYTNIQKQPNTIQFFVKQSPKYKPTVIMKFT